MQQLHLDDIDRAIVAQLIEDGRKSFTEIATDLGVSAGTIRNRLTRLQETGTLRVMGFVDLDQVGLHAYATVYVRVSPSRLISQVIEQLSQYPEVSFLASVAGDYDLHVDVQCFDNPHLTAFLREHIQPLEGVIETKTTMVLQIHKYGQPDLEELRKSAENLQKKEHSS